MALLKKIVVIGPESTGKSSLCEGLATYYDTYWCREYAREYLLAHGKDYQYEDLQRIAAGQITLEEQAVAQCLADRKPYLFIDTDMYVMKVWSEYVFGKCEAEILDRINERHYDFYLLADIDLPWTKDELREYPDEGPRRELFHIYKDLLVNQTVPWGIVSGQNGARLQNAIHLLEAHGIVGKLA